MKIKNQSIPSYLTAAYARLVKNRSVILSGLIVGSMTKKARRPRQPKKKRKVLTDYERAIDFLIAYITQRDGIAPPAGFRATRLRELKQGIFNPAYWEQCAQESSQILENAPTYAAWPAPPQLYWQAITWSPQLGLFVACAKSGAGDYAAISSDGKYWLAQPVASFNDWRSVCWSPELGILVAVASTGTGDRVMTSPDGVTWTARASATDNEWRSVCWSPQLALLVAVASTGTGDRVMTSPDGITWTARASAADNEWRSVCWSPQLALLVAVASTGTGDRVMTSPDGITWTARASAADNEWRSVCWSPELALLVAVASTGTGDRVMTSPDGITWTARASAADNEWRSVCWSPTLALLVAVASTGYKNRVMCSTDGIAWTAYKSSKENPWQAVSWSPGLGLLVAVADLGGVDRFMYSTNGKTWHGIQTGRNYAYPDAANLPTRPIYGNGTPSSGALTYTGSTIGGIFRDTLLRWERVVFTLRNKFTTDSQEPVFIKITGALQASASTRSARCLLSIILKHWLVTDTSTRPSTVENPTVEPKSCYWRYRRPSGVPPYWNYNNNMRLIYTMRAPKYEESPGELAKCVVLIAPMPALGKRFNNNTSMHSSITPAIELWQIKKQTPVVAYVRIISGVVVINGILYATAYHDGPEVHEGDDFEALLTPYAGAVAAAAQAAGVYDQFTWGIDRYILIAQHSAGFYQQINSSYDIADAFISY